MDISNIKVLFPSKQPNKIEATDNDKLIVPQKRTTNHRPLRS